MEAIFIINGCYFRASCVPENKLSVYMNFAHTGDGGSEEICFQCLEFYSEPITKGLEGRDRRIYVTEIPDEIFNKIQPDIPITISHQHVFSLSELVKWFKKMIEDGNMPEQPGRSNVLTAGYCDELLEDLEQ